MANRSEGTYRHRLALRSIFARARPAAVGTGRPASADLTRFQIEGRKGSHSLRPKTWRDESVAAFADYRVETMIGEPMKELSDTLERVVRSAEAILLRVPEEETTKPVLRG